VLVYDGIHGLGNEKKATIDLPQGRVPIKLEYFQNQFGLGLVVGWSGPGFGRRSLSGSNASTPAKKDFAKLLVTEGPGALGAEKLARLQKLKKDLDALKKQKVPAEMALCVTEAGRQAPETFLFQRGNPQVKGAKVEPGFLQVLGFPEPTLVQPGSGAETSGRR